MRNKPEFQLAIGIFVAMSIFGTIFALWWANRYIAIKPRTNTDQSTESSPPPVPQSPPQAPPGAR